MKSVIILFSLAIVAYALLVRMKQMVLCVNVCAVPHKSVSKQADKGTERQIEKEKEGLYLHSSSLNIFIFEGEIEIRTFKSRFLKINSRRRQPTLFAFDFSREPNRDKKEPYKQQKQKRVSFVFRTSCDPLGVHALCIYAVQMDKGTYKNEVNERHRYFWAWNIHIWTMTHNPIGTFVSIYFSIQFDSIKFTAGEKN